MSLEKHAFQTCICSLIVFNSFVVLYLMCCFGNNPFVYGFYTNKNSVLFYTNFIVFGLTRPGLELTICEYAYHYRHRSTVIDHLTVLDKVFVLLSPVTC